MMVKMDDFPKGKSYEFIYFPLFSIILLLCEIYDLSQSIELKIMFVTGGLLHILARDILAYMYNFQRVVFPFLPRVTPSFLIVLGVGLIVLELFFP